jgi:hypothetical protein
MSGQWLLRWAFWTLFFSIALGGKPWIFPQGGRLWLDSISESVRFPN